MMDGWGNRLRTDAAWIFALPAIPFAYFLFRYGSTAYFGFGAVLLAAYGMALLRWDRARGLPIRIFALVFIALALPALGLWQFGQYRDIGDLDHASYSTALWNFRHGSAGYSFEGMNMLGIHSQYLAVAWVPVQAWFGEIGLKAGQAICLLTAVLLLFRRHFGSGQGASWGAVALLLSPAVASQFLFGFHPEILGAPLLVLALDAYRRERLLRFLVLTALVSYCKEVFTLAIAGILLVAWVERRGWRWVLLPGLLCCAQMALYWFVILPRFAPEGNFLSFFFPRGPGDVARLWFSAETLLYAFHLLLPCLPLLAVLPKRYLLLPLPLMAFYSSFPDPLFRVIWPNYAFLPTMMAMAGLALNRDAPDGQPGNAPWNAARLQPRSEPLVEFRSKVLFSAAVMSLLCYPLWRELMVFPKPDPARSRAVRDILDRVPEEASLLVNAGFTARLAARKELALWGEKSVWGKRPQPVDHYDFILLDGRFKPAWLTDGKELEASLDTLARSPSRVTLFAKDSLYLFGKREAF